MGNPRMAWGKWKLNPKNRTIFLERDGEWIYEFDLDHGRNSAEVLDFIFQVVKKPWITTEEMFDLLHAIDDVLDPQGQLCSFGKNSPINPKENMEKYMKSDPERFKKMMEELTLPRKGE